MTVLLATFPGLLTKPRFQFSLLTKSPTSIQIFPAHQGSENKRMAISYALDPTYAT